MRGLAILAAAASVWVLATGVTPRLKVPHVPRMRAPIVLASLAAAVAGTVVALALLGVPSVAVAIGLLTSAIPPALAMAGTRARQEAIAAAWPDVLARMRSRLMGGATLVEAFVAAIEAAPAQLAAFAPRVDEAVRYGNGFPAALEDLRHELVDPVTDRVTMTLAVANVAGGGKVGEVLAALSTSVADELRFRRAHQATMTEQRLTALVALVAPWGLLALTIATNPQSKEAYLAQVGTLIVGIGLAGTGIGFILALRSARLAASPRVLR